MLQLTTVMFRASLKFKQIFSYCELIRNCRKSWTKTLENFRCQIEVPFIVKSFLVGKTLNLQQFCVKSLELSNRNKLQCSFHL